MTKEEARIILAGTYQVSIDDEWHRADSINEALDMEIEALSCSEKPNSSDVIGWKYDAVKGLDDFTKAFCRDDSVKDDLVFRCKQCEFEMPDGRCFVKVVAREICPDYKNFGSMGDL